MSSVFLFDESRRSPQENLALDEALLRLCDSQAQTPQRCGYLRFWESSQLFVTLGVSSRLNDDVELSTCQRDEVQVLRRASGGGTVLQGPGCLNVAVVLPFEDWPALRDLNTSYQTIVRRLTDALGLESATLRGSSDLALGDLKFGGSAQKRTKNALLHHSSLLYDFDLEHIPAYLKEPKKQPDYREGRDHLSFVTNLALDASEIRQRMTTAWGATSLPEGWEPPPVEVLVEEKYSKWEWSSRF